MKALKILAIALIMPLGIQANQKISLKDAVDKKMVSAKITGTGYTTTNFSSHYGECMKFEVTNLSSTPIDVFIETGRFLIPENDSVQAMMITKEMFISLNSKASRIFIANAMCTQKPNLSPNSKRKFKIGEMATGKLLQLAKLIEKYNYQDPVAQSAVWVITNKTSFTNIYTSDSVKVKILRDFLTDKPSTNNSLFKESSNVFIEGKFAWTMEKSAMVSIVVLNEYGNEIAKIMSNTKYEKGKQNYSFKYSGCLLEPAKTYKVRLKIQDYTVDELACTSE